MVERRLLGARRPRGLEQRFQQPLAPLEGDVQRADFLGLRLQLFVLAGQFLALLRQLVGLARQLLGLVRQLLGLLRQLLVLLGEFLALRPQFVGLGVYLGERLFEVFAQPDDGVDRHGADPDVREGRGEVGPQLEAGDLARGHEPEDLDAVGDGEDRRHRPEGGAIAGPHAHQQRDRVGERHERGLEDHQPQADPDDDQRRRHRQRGEAGGPGENAEISSHAVHTRSGRPWSGPTPPAGVPPCRRRGARRGRGPRPGA